MKRIQTFLSAAVLLTGATCMTGQDLIPARINPDNPASQEFQRDIKANRTRVETEMKDAKISGDLVWYAVRPLSELMRLSNFYPQDGRLNGNLRVVAAQGEFEPASFLLYSLRGENAVMIDPSDLKDDKGNTIPAKNLDVKVVKVWYQNGNRWLSYFADPELRLCPELLLKDENMVKVDTNEVANYARIRRDGKDFFEWISAPKELDPRTFNPSKEGFSDAETLQPSVLVKDQFKQYFVTVKVPEKQTPGVYSGTVSVKAGTKTLLSIPLELRVLPFELPPPGPRLEPDQTYISSIMCGGFSLSDFRKRFPDEKTAMAKFRRDLQNAKDHNLLYPGVEQTPEVLAIIKEMGFPTKPYMGNSFAPWFALNYGGRMSFDNHMAAKRGAKQCADFYNEHLGHSDILVSYGDEQGTAFVVTHRGFFKYYEEYGIKMGCAGHGALFHKGGYAYGVHPYGGYPDDHDRIKRWRDIGDKWIGFYAGQHTASENPAYLRRQNGYLSYFSDLNMNFNYEFALGPWNDLASELYRPMVVAYRNHGGLVDTLQWEAFREAIDDIRYATLLQHTIRESINSGNINRIVEAKKALQYMAQIKPDEADLDAVRAEMINYILKLRALATPSANAPVKG